MTANRGMTTTPLDKLLAVAIRRATDPALRRWLKRLQAGDMARPTAQAPRPPTTRERAGQRASKKLAAIGI
jgi:hypothetical protein